MATFNCQSLRGWPSTVFSCVGDGQAGSLDGQRRSSAFVTQPGRNMASIFHLCGNVQLDEGQAIIFWVFEVSYILFSPGAQLRYGLILQLHIMRQETLQDILHHFTGLSRGNHRCHFRMVQVTQVTRSWLGADRPPRMAQGRRFWLHQTVGWQPAA